jgi:isopentenyl-diphosphate delta-isomerase
MPTENDISVVLVNQDDEVVGYGKKLDVHQKGILHRAFSVLIFNDEGQLLLQKRSENKYHAAGLWANTCCGHPFPGEPSQAAAERRLYEELGLKYLLQPLTQIYYKKFLDHGMIEHEYVHVFKGQYKGESIICDPREVAECAWISIVKLQDEVRENPEKYAAWFSHYVEEYSDRLFSPSS